MRDEIREFTGTAGNRLVATVAGTGRPVLLLAGGGQTRHAWDDTIRRLARAGRMAVAVDMRGHGDSDWAADGGYAFQDFSGDILAVADQLADRAGARPAAVGASLGGITALLVLGRRADAFTALVMVDVTPHLDPGGVAAIQGFMRAAGPDGFSSIEAAADAIAAYLPHRPRPRSLEGLRKNLRRGADGRWRWHWDPRFLDGPRSINHAAEATFVEAVAAAKGLVVPTLLVRGRSSELVTEAAVEEFQRMRPDAEIADVGGARHMVAGDQNDAFSAAILDFLARRVAG